MILFILPEIDLYCTSIC